MKLIVFSGLPGTGKSTLAEAVGKALQIPVFAKDWLEATLLKSGLKPTLEDKSLGFAGYELLTVLAQRQLGRIWRLGERAGQSPHHEFVALLAERERGRFA